MSRRSRSGSEEGRSTPEALVLHDGELADVLELLGSMEVVCTGGPPLPDPDRPVRLLIGTPRHMAAPAPPASVRIALCDASAPGLSTRLQGLECDFAVRRPIHPSALRGLLLHALYDGPEKRRRPRVALGEPVEVESGGRRSPALLVGLSARGAGLVQAEPPAMGDEVEVVLPAALTRGASHALAARVIAVEAEPEGDGGRGFSVVFSSLSSASQSIVSQIMRARARAQTLPVARPVGSAVPSTRSRVGRRASRASERKPYPKAVLATKRGSATPLLGRDVSIGGMRVAPTHGLALGDELKLALYGPPGLTPAVVVAEVARDDGELGWVLHFRDPGPEGRAALEAVVQALPVLASASAGGDDFTPVVVSEVVDGRP